MYQVVKIEDGRKITTTYFSWYNELVQGLWTCILCVVMGVLNVIFATPYLMIISFFPGPKFNGVPQQWYAIWWAGWMMGLSMVIIGILGFFVFPFTTIWVLWKPRIVSQEEEFLDPEELPDFDERLKNVCKEVGETAKKEAFAKGLPVCFMREEKMIWLYPDGTEKEDGPGKTPGAI